MISFSDRLLDRLSQCGRVAVLTGAGASAESGIPTFRDPQGLWARFNPAELASPQGFKSNPVRVQSWYTARRKAVLEADPNPGHRALARLQDFVHPTIVITQNVDGLHHRAGSDDVIEVHGNLHRTCCVSCRQETEPFDVSPNDAEPARCGCGGLLRPDVVWFGEPLQADALQAAAAAAMGADVFLVVGTGAEVYPAAGFPLIASEAGAYVVEVNVRATAISDSADEVLRGPAGVILPALVDAVGRLRTAVAKSASGVDNP